MTSMPNPLTSTLPALRCPKCAAEMATYERSGVVIDQCRECRGIYLDRAELEKLIDAEGAMAAREASGSLPPMGHGASAPAGSRPPMGYAASAPAGSPRSQRPEWHDGDEPWERDGRRDGGWDASLAWGDDRRRDDRDDDDRRRPSRKRSFLGELFEGFGD